MPTQKSCAFGSSPTPGLSMKAVMPVISTRLIQAAAA